MPIRIKRRQCMPIGLCNQTNQCIVGHEYATHLDQNGAQWSKETYMTGVTPLGRSFKLTSQSEMVSLTSGNTHEPSCVLRPYRNTIVIPTSIKMVVWDNLYWSQQNTCVDTSSIQQTLDVHQQPIVGYDSRCDVSRSSRWVATSHKYLCMVHHDTSLIELGSETHLS